MSEYLYRYEISQDLRDKWKLHEVKFPIVRRTPCGAWIEKKYGREKWVSTDSRNRYAHATPKDALKHFVRRKMYRNVCIERELEKNEEVLIEVKRLIKEL